MPEPKENPFIAGLETLSAVQLAKVDSVKPTLAMLPAGEKGGADFFYSAVTVSLNGTDVGSGVARVEISLNEGQTWQTLSLVNDIWRYDWKTANLPDGRYRVIVRAWDVAGNVQSPGVSVVLRVDNRVPDNATLTLPFATASPTPLETATATLQPTQTVTATRKPVATSTPVPAPPLIAKPLPLWPIVGLIGLLLALASASLTDHRPHALRRIAQTFHQIVAQKKLDDGQ